MSTSNETNPTFWAETTGSARPAARILIVDDDIINRLMLSRYVELLGYHSQLAEDGQGALNLLAAQPFDAVLLDIDMPGLSGYEVLQNLKQNPILRQLPVIMISAVDNLDSTVRCIELGAEDYLTKPFNPVFLRARLNACLEKKYLREQQENLLRREVERLAKMTELKDQFVGTVSHDLKSPVNIILGFADLLEESFAANQISQAQVEKYLNRIRSNAKKILGLVSDLLDLARIENGSALNLQKIEIVKFFGEQVVEFKVLAHQKNIRLDFQSSLTSFEMLFDPLLITQAIDNLLSNALKYTPASGGLVFLRVSSPDEYDGQILIEVCDTGLGIPDTAIPHLFDRFYRVPTTEHQAVAGSGLGLSIVKAIVENHTGKIWVESELGQGS